MKKIITTLTLATSFMAAIANVEIQTVGGWFEGGYITWTPIEEASSYNVYYKAVSASSYEKLDDPLVRDYSDFGRADIVGIPAGWYQFKVVPVDNEGTEMNDLATESDSFEAKAYDRSGYAHFKSASSDFLPSTGIGAYKNDGTLKSGAKVFYVYSGNADKIKTSVITDAKGGKTEAVGLQSIIDLYQKGYDQTPLDFRIIGTLSESDMDHFSSSSEGIQIKGNKAYSPLNITIEGIGNDATIHGFGFLLRNACSVELRNFAIMWCKDDAVSMDTDNSNLWIHHLDLFYGRPGSASDKKKGDGTLDIKGDSKYSTLSYNHLWDSGKASLCGMTSESGPNYLTYHHNWFDHSDSRHPRVRTMSVHVYNNYFDGNCKYGVGATMGADVLVEGNYFRHCKYPMLISRQGSDVHNGVGTADEIKGTFSKEDGGIIKAYDNYMTGQKSYQPYKAGDATLSVHFDAYEVASLSDIVPNTVQALQGGDTYSNFDTDPALFYSEYIRHETKDVPTIVKGQWGAGRCQHGDFTWSFDDSEDNNEEVIPALSTAIQNYKSSLVGFFTDDIDQPGSGNGGESGGNGEGTDPEPMSGTQICHFTDKKPSLALVTVKGNYSDSKGSVTYGGKKYEVCVKMESSTSISIRPTAKCNVTLIFGGSTQAANQTFILDGNTKTLDAQGQYQFQAEAGATYTLTKDKSINLFLIIFQTEGSALREIADEDSIDQPIFDLQGRRIINNRPLNGQFYLRGGKIVKY